MATRFPRAKIGLSLGNHETHFKHGVHEGTRRAMDERRQGDLVVSIQQLLLVRSRMK